MPDRSQSCTAGRQSDPGPAQTDLPRPAWSGIRPPARAAIWQHSSVQSMLVQW